MYDNVYLGFDNRRRMLAGSDIKRVNILNEYRAAVLIDGIVSAGWVIEEKKGAAVLAVEPYHKIPKREVRDAEVEGLAFLKFMRPEAKSWDVRVLSA